MTTARTQYRFLAPSQNSAYKQPFIDGTRIRARVLYGWYVCDEPMTVEEIAVDYGIPVEAVREAIVYCESNPPELEKDYRREAELMEAAGSNRPGYKYDPTPRLISPQDREKLKRT